MRRLKGSTGGRNGGDVEARPKKRRNDKLMIHNSDEGNVTAEEQSCETTPSCPSSKKKRRKKTGRSAAAIDKSSTTPAGRFELPLMQRLKDCRIESPAMAKRDDRAASPPSVAQPGLLMFDSGEEARAHLRWMIAPIGVQLFIDTMWEKTVAYVARRRPDYYGHLFGTDQLFNLMQQNYMEFSTNVNLARYVKGERETLNPTGRAIASVVRRYYEQEGCSVQLINPQSFCPNVATLCARLQEKFGCFVGANTYLTPKGTQGFAPHWDEIDAYVLQLEGRKHWKVYSPPADDEVLPRESSHNFSVAEMHGRRVVWEGCVEAGDLLYIPRGFIHHGHADSSHHSLHITISAGRKNTYGDLLLKILPDVLALCIDSDSAFRHSLPPSYLDYMGVANDNKEVNDEQRVDEFNEMVSTLMGKVGRKVVDMAHTAVDMHAEEAMQTWLPPVLTETERECSAFGCEGGMPAFEDNVNIKFIRRHAQRLIYESETEGRLEHRTHNSRVCGQRKTSPIPLQSHLLPAAEYLLSSYPSYVSSDDIPCDDRQHTTQLLSQLWSHGLLMVEPSCLL